MVLLTEPKAATQQTEPTEYECCQVCSRMYSDSRSWFRKMVGTVKLLKFKRTHGKKQEEKVTETDYSQQEVPAPF